MLEENGQSLLDRMNAISFSLCGVMVNANLFGGFDVVGDLRCLYGVASLVCFVCFHILNSNVFC